MYDNTRIAVKEIAGDSERKPAEAFSGSQSHYLFAARFGRPGKGNDKGKVERLVGYARRNFMVPVPRAASWEKLNAELLEQCRTRRERKLWGHTETIAERFERDRERWLPLPPAPFEACEQRTTRASPHALVQYETCDYSVPVEYRHRQVLEGFGVGGGDRLLERSHCAAPPELRREEMIFNLLHYLALLEQKTNALDQAAPLEGWQLPEEFLELRRQMEGRLGKRGRLLRHRATAAAAGKIIRTCRWPRPGDYDFLAIPTLNKKLVVELAQCEWIGGGRTCWRWATAGRGRRTSAWRWDWRLVNRWPPSLLGRI